MIYVNLIINENCHHGFFFHENFVNCYRVSDPFRRDFDGHFTKCCHSRILMSDYTGRY